MPAGDETSQGTATGEGGRLELVLLVSRVDLASGANAEALALWYSGRIATGAIAAYDEQATNAAEALRRLSGAV